MKFSVGCIIALSFNSIADACTSVGVTAGASADGSTMVTHTSDCRQCDSRVAYIPGQTHVRGTMRPVYLARMEYPREVSFRSETYYPEPGQNLSVPVGYIPEATETYGYYESLYGYMNEHGLSVGESTGVSKFPVPRENLKALLWIRPLTQLAMERCKTARCAVQTMGSLAEEYGFYGEDPGAASAAESLLVADGKELWAFEISGDDTHRSAFWAAARVPDGHVVVLANNVIIREIDCDDHDNFYCSKDLPERLKKAGVWNGKGKLDWNRALSPDLRHFEYIATMPPLPEYSTARIWRVFTRVAPSLDIQLTDDTHALPFSVKAERKLTHRDVMDLKRDHYEGTEIDLTVGIAAGPYGSPYRPDAGDGMAIRKGQFSRGISLPRTSYCSLGQSFGSKDQSDSSKRSLNKWWYATDTPASSVFVPFYPQSSKFSRNYRVGQMNKWDDESAWWVFDWLANWMGTNYRMMSVDVKAKVVEQQDWIDEKIQRFEDSPIVKSTDPGSSEVLPQDTLFSAMGDIQEQIQTAVVNVWRDFGRAMLVKYNDGLINRGDGIPVPIGYPVEWLDQIGYNNDIRTKWAKPARYPPASYQNRDVAIGQPTEFLAADSELSTMRRLVAWAPTLMTYFTLFAIGWLFGTRSHNRVDVNDHEYRVAPGH